MNQSAIDLLGQCLVRLSECAVEIGNLDDPRNPVAVRARATINGVAIFLSYSPHNWNHSMKTSAKKIAAALRQAAAWIEEHDIDGEELINAGVNGWADKEIHLTRDAFLRLAVNPSFSEAGHGTAVLGDATIVCCPAPKEAGELAACGGER